MAITRLIYGRSAMEGLYPLPDAWYAQNRITAWLNTTARAIDASARTVEVGTGEKLRYDRLILATGPRSHVPDLGGFGTPGSFVLRSAEDAMRVRSFAQQEGCWRVGDRGRRAARPRGRLRAALGIDVTFGAEATAVDRRDGSLAVALASGGERPADMLLVCAGSRPTTGL